MRDALAVVVGDPGLWLLGLLGFAARGGLLLLALPIVTIPGPVLLSIVFRDQVSSANGLADSPLLVLLGAMVVAGVILFGVLAAAWAEVHAFERTVSDPETEVLRGGRVARPMEGGERVVAGAVGGGHLRRRPGAHPADGAGGG